MSSAAAVWLKVQNPPYHVQGAGSSLVRLRVQVFESGPLKVVMLTRVIDRLGRTIVTCLVFVFLSDNVVIDNLGAYVRRWKTIMEQPHILRIVSVIA